MGGACALFGGTSDRHLNHGYFLFTVWIVAYGFISIDYLIWYGSFVCRLQAKEGQYA